MRLHTPVVITCNDNRREVSAIQHIANKQIDRTFAFDKVCGLPFLLLLLCVTWYGVFGSGGISKIRIWNLLLFQEFYFLRAWMSEMSRAFLSMKRIRNLLTGFIFLYFVAWLVEIITKLNNLLICGSGLRPSIPAAGVIWPGCVSYCVWGTWGL